MQVRNPKAVQYSNKLIEYTLVAKHNGLLTLPFATINALNSELHNWSKSWLKTNLIIYTSGSRISAINSERLAIKAYFKLKKRIDDFSKFTVNHGIHKLYGYEFTINPQKLNPENVTKVNRKIIRELKKRHQIALIERALEYTWRGTSINYHLHYLVIATGRINQRNTYRKIKKIAKGVTGSSVNKSTEATKPYRTIDDWQKAESYVTKQCGRYPLMLVHNQWQRFNRLSEKDKVALVARTFKQSKGLVLHQFYVNSGNHLAKVWHTKFINKRYCEKRGTLVRVTLKSSNNNRMSVFGKPFDKLCTSDHRKPTKAISRHHYSEIEALSRIYGRGVYGLEKLPKKFKSMSIF